MNIYELECVLLENKVDRSSYSLTGGLPNECYVISNEGSGIWEVYYSEKGIKSSLKIFYSENEACSYLLKILVNDFTVNMNP